MISDVIFDVISDMISDVIFDVISDVISAVTSEASPKQVRSESDIGETKVLEVFYEKILHNFGITIHNTCDDSVRNGIGRNDKNGISQDSYPS